jgi:tetratricopeptide (TPR) repeat protein
MPETGPEIPRVEELVGEEGHHPHRYGRMIAIATVITTLIGGLVAFAQAGSLRLHDKADARAEQYGALALNAASVNRGKTDVQISRLNLLTQQVRAADNGSLFQSYGTSSLATQLLSNRWKAIAAQTATDTAAIAASQQFPYICSPTLQSHCPAANAAYSQEQDPRYPARFTQQGQWSAYRLTALRDASNQQADDAEGQFVHYAAALTMLAVAVFLFGYSLTPQGATRRTLYSRVAVGFVAVAGVWGLIQALSPVSAPPDAAATAFANGEVALGTGSNQAAIADFNRALALRPRFVDAYADRAQAEYAAGFPVTGTGQAAEPTTAGPATIPRLTALDQAIDDDQRAREEGSGSATLLVDLGKDLFLRGVLRHDTGDLQASHSDLESAIEKLKPQENASGLLAQAYLRLAEGDLVLRAGTTGSEFRQAGVELGAPDVPREQTVAAGLTDLSLIANSYPKLATAAGNDGAEIVGAGGAGSTTPTGAKPSRALAVQLAGITAQPDPGHALFTIDRPGHFDPAKDSLSVQWRYRDPVHGEWATLPEISGPIGNHGLVPDGNGYASNNIAYPSSTNPATCLPQGQYRVELYVNGRLAGSATAKSDWPALHAVRFSAVDGAVCVPDGWSSLPLNSAGAGGYATKRQDAGAVIFSIPKAAVASIANDQSSLATVMQAAVQAFSGGGGPLPGLQQVDKPQSTQFFMSSANGQLEHWTYQHGDVLTGVGTSSNGEVYIGVAWGPSRSDTATFDEFLSLSPL